MEVSGNESHAFRKLNRIKQKMSDEACIELLKKELRGVLSVQGDHGYPYGVPMNHFYNEADGKIYFHSGKVGHKIDAMRRNDKVSYCVIDSGTHPDGEWFLRFQSVIVFGRIEFVDDRETMEQIARNLSYKFTQDEAYIETEIRQSGPATQLFALVPEEICGKMVNER